MLYTTTFGADLSVGYLQTALHNLCALDAAGFKDLHLNPLGQGIFWPSIPKWAEQLAVVREQGPQSRFVNLIHHTPDAVVEPLVRISKVNLAYTVTESDLIPRWLARALSQLDGLIVPTEWQRQSWGASGVTAPIHVVPHAMGPYWWQASTEVAPDRAPIFGYVGTWNARKNPEGVLRAYLRAFPKQGETRLALKLTGPVGFRKYLEAVVEEETGSTARLDDETGDIWVWLEGWSEAQISWFHDLIDVYVSAHRGEGWGYGLMMAALRGRKVIYTDWSAPTEFLSEAAGDTPIPYTLVEIGNMGGNDPKFLDLRRQLRWANPDMDALVAALRTATSARRSAQATEAMRQRYCWAQVGQELRAVIGQYEEVSG